MNLSSNDLNSFFKKKKRVSDLTTQKTQVVLTDFHALEGSEALAVTSTGDIGGGGV